MTAEAGPAPLADPAPLPVRDAAEAADRALDRVRLSQRGYRAARERGSALAVTRARTDWGLAVLEWIEASVALAEAEDHRDPVRAARDSRAGQPASRRAAPVASPGADPARDQIAVAWWSYQRARRDGTPDRIAAARGEWRAALVGWFQAVADQRTAEDRYAEHQPPAPGQPPAAGHAQAPDLPPPPRAPLPLTGWTAARPLAPP